MKSTSRTATLDQLRDLIERPPRAYLAFDQDGSINAAPVTFQSAKGRYLISPVGEGFSAPRAGQTAMLLIDEGRYSLELRGLRIRGSLRDAEAPVSGLGEARWLELVPERVIGWDYGKMRKRGRA